MKNTKVYLMSTENVKDPRTFSSWKEFLSKERWEKTVIQTAATKVTNIGVRLSSGASFCLRKISIYQLPYSGRNTGIHHNIFYLWL